MGWDRVGSLAAIEWDYEGFERDQRRLGKGSRRIGKGSRQGLWWEGMERNGMREGLDVN